MGLEIRKHKRLGSRLVPLPRRPRQTKTKCKRFLVTQRFFGGHNVCREVSLARYRVIGGSDLPLTRR